MDLRHIQLYCPRHCGIGSLLKVRLGNTPYLAPIIAATVWTVSVVYFVHRHASALGRLLHGQRSWLVCKPLHPRTPHHHHRRNPRRFRTWPIIPKNNMNWPTNVTCQMSPTNVWWKNFYIKILRPIQIQQSVFRWQRSLDSTQSHRDHILHRPQVHGLLLTEIYI